MSTGIFCILADFSRYFSYQSLSVFAKKAVEYYRTYPTIDRNYELCAYYKSCNISFPNTFLLLTVSLGVCSLLSDVLFLVDRVPLHIIVISFAVQLGIILIFYAVSCYMNHLRQTACAVPSKHCFELQRSIRIKLSVAGVLPVLGFAMALMLQPHDTHLQELCELGWVMSTLLESHVCAWLVGGVLYPALIMLCFNAVYCGLAFWRGCFTFLITARAVVPVSLSTLFFIILDRFTKENFILKRALNQQKKMYKKFLEQMQDPVMIYNQERTLLFRNKAADDWIHSVAGDNTALTGIETVSNFSRLSNIISPSRRATLEIDVNRRLSQRLQSEHLVSKERYYSYGCPHSRDGDEELEGNLRGEDNDCPRTNLKGSKRVLDVTLIESTTFSGSQKTISLVLHDATDELEREAKRAEEKYKNMLLFSLSHELKTPLNIFQGFLDASKEWMKTEEMRNMRRDAKGAWRYLRNKINDILDYAQILSNEFALHKSTFSIRRFVEYLRKTTMYLLTDKRKRVRLEFGVDAAIRDEFQADRDRLEQVLFNFLCNAAKFTETGSISLRVLHNDTGEFPLVTFEVRDTGCGMSHEKAESLFKLSTNRKSGDADRMLGDSNKSLSYHFVGKKDGESNAPGDSEHGSNKNLLYVSELGKSPVSLVLPREDVKSPQQNPVKLVRLKPCPAVASSHLSGLGLTVSKMICEKMGCNIQVITELDTGSAFSFSLPDAERAFDATASSPAKVADPGRMDEAANSEDSVPDENSRVVLTYQSLKTRHHLTLKFPRITSLSVFKRAKKPERVALIVDDNYFNRFVAESMIKKLGIQTSTAENGKIAIEKLAQLQRENEAARILVFMDLDMPTMDGIRATTEIRKANAQPRPYIIALTAFSAESERARCFEAGMDAFIGKPLTKERLYEVLVNINAAS